MNQGSDGAEACTGRENAAWTEPSGWSPLTILEGLPTPAILVTGERGDAAILSGANPGVAEILGEPVAAGIPLAQFNETCPLYRPDRRAPVPSADLPVVRALARGESVRDEEVHLRRSDGEWRVLLASAAPLRRDGRIGGAIASFEDITERRQAEDALRQSESRYRLLTEQSADAVCVTDNRGNILSISTRGTELVGYTREELLGMNVTHLIPAEDLKADPLRLDRLVAGETVVRERRLRRKDGTILPVEISAKRVDGEMLQGIVRDITERKRAENSLRFLAEATNVLNASLDYTDTLEKLARLVVPILGDWCIMYVIEEDQTVRRAAIVHADPAKADLAQRLMECPAPLLERVRPQLKALESGRPQFLPSVPDTLLQALATGGPEHLAVLRELGATAAMVVPFWGRDRLLGVAHFFMTEPGRRYDPADLALAEETARRAAVAVENARLYQEAREANAAKDQFLAVLSHELRNPLSSILTGVDVLRRTMCSDERAQRALAIVERNSQLQARLINDLLDLSRIARGKIQLQRAPVSLAAVVHAAVQGVRGDAEEAGIDLVVNTEADVWVHGDLDRLQQVVMNLLSNAVKFTPPPGRVTLRVERAACTAGGNGPAADTDASKECGRIIVEDTGIGISRELLPKLFTMFQQGEVGAQHKPGLGIGLSLVRSITEKHGGRVWAESGGPGTGSRFTVELPLISPPAGAPAGGPGPRNLLLVEDNPDTRGILAESLELEGYVVRAVESAEEGLAALRAERPDAILSDIGLPGMDGYEFLRRARELPGVANVPAFAVTGYGQDEDVARARQSGYAGHFVKPVDVAVLAQRIREWLAGGAAH